MSETEEVCLRVSTANIGAGAVSGAVSRGSAGVCLSDDFLLRRKLERFTFLPKDLSDLSLLSDLSELD